MTTSAPYTSVTWAERSLEGGHATGSVPVQCRNARCGSYIGPAARKFVRCSKCRTVTCLSCDAVHDGMNCKTYQESLSNLPGPVSSKQNSTADGETGSYGSLHEDEHDKKPDRIEICTKEGCFAEFSLPWWAEKFRCPFCYLEYTLFPGGGRKEDPKRLTDYWEEKERKPEEKQAVDKPEAKPEEKRAVDKPDDDGKTGKWQDEKQHISTDGHYALMEPKEVGAVPEKEKLVECAKEGCDGLAVVDHDVDLFKCPQCTCFTCLKCQVIHESQTCEAYQASLREPVPDIKQKKRQQTTVAMDVPVRIEKVVSCFNDKCNGQALVDKQAKRFECPLCKESNCLECKASHLSYMTCHDYQNMFDDMQDSKDPLDIRQDTAVPCPEDPRQLTSQEKAVKCCDEKCNGKAFVDHDVSLFKCPVCSRFSCLKCQVIHENMTCEQYNRWIAEGLASDQIDSWNTKDTSADLPRCSQTSGHCGNVHCGHEVKFSSTDVNITCAYCGRDTCLKCGSQHRSSVPCPKPREDPQQTAEMLPVPMQDGVVRRRCCNPKCNRDNTTIASEKHWTCWSCGTLNRLSGTKKKANASLNSKEPENTPSVQPAIELDQAEAAAVPKSEMQETMVYCKDNFCKGRGYIDMQRQRQYECPICEKINCLDCDAIHQGGSCPKQKGVVTRILDSFWYQMEKLQKQGDCQQVQMACEDPKCDGMFLVDKHQRKYQCPKCRREIHVERDFFLTAPAGTQQMTTKKDDVARKSFSYQFQPESPKKGPQHLRKFHCKNPSCGTEGEIWVEDKSFLCRQCNKKSCVLCDAMHLGFTCRQYQIMKKDGPFQQRSEGHSSPVHGTVSYAEATKKGKPSAKYQGSVV